MAPTDSNQYEYGGTSQTQQKFAQPKSINALNTINAVLLRKDAIEKLQRYFFNFFSVERQNILNSFQFL